MASRSGRLPHCAGDQRIATSSSADRRMPRLADPISLTTTERGEGDRGIDHTLTGGGRFIEGRTKGYSLWAPTRHSACRVYPPAPFRNGPRLEDTIEGYSEDSLFRTGARVGNRGGVSARKGGRATVERSCRRR